MLSSRSFYTAMSLFNFIYWPKEKLTNIAELICCIAKSPIAIYHFHSMENGKRDIFRGDQCLSSYLILTDKVFVNSNLSRYLKKKLTQT